MATVTDEHEHTHDGDPPKPRRPTSSQVLLGLGVLAALGTLMLWPLGRLPGHFEPEVGRVVFGNIPGVLEAAFYVATATFLGVSLYLFSLRARNWQRGQGERRTGDWGARFKQLERGLSMKTLLRDKQAGMMHAMVYFGFVVLFLGTVTLEIDHILPNSLKFLEGGVYQGYSLILDLAAVVYLGGLSWAFVRRFIQKP
jgi:hypothetical protein